MRFVTNSTSQDKTYESSDYMCQNRNDWSHLFYAIFLLSGERCIFFSGRATNSCLDFRIHLERKIYFIFQYSMQNMWECLIVAFQTLQKAMETKNEAIMNIGRTRPRVSIYY